ncbi:hypothetical protein CKO27_00455 [Thiocystis violacea]|nr:hypothetical protein [Thiocystis violacea]
MTLCFYNPVDEDSRRFLEVGIAQPGLDDLGDVAFIATGGLYLLAEDCLISIGGGNTSRPETQARRRAAADIARGRFKDLR